MPPGEIAHSLKFLKHFAHGLLGDLCASCELRYSDSTRAEIGEHHIVRRSNLLVSSRREALSYATFKIAGEFAQEAGQVI